MRWRFAICGTQLHYEEQQEGEYDEWQELSVAKLWMKKINQANDGWHPITDTKEEEFLILGHESGNSDVDIPCLVDQAVEPSTSQQTESRIQQIVRMTSAHILPSTLRPLGDDPPTRQSTDANSTLQSPIVPWQLATLHDLLTAGSIGF